MIVCLINNIFLPTSRNLLSIFLLPNWALLLGPGCPDSSSFCPLSSSGQENGCFGVVLATVGVALCKYISLKGVCDDRVKNRGWGWYSGQNETPSGPFVRKVGISALELGGKFNHVCLGHCFSCPFQPRTPLT